MAAYALVLASAHAASAIQFFNNATVPTNLTAVCSNALLTNVTSCGAPVSSMRVGRYYPESVLSSTCTPECSNGLASFASSVLSACSTETWNGYENTIMPLAIIPDILRYTYDLTCLMDSGRYCNVVAAQYAYSLDPASGDPADTSDIASFSDNSTTTAPVDTISPCDLCLLKNLRFEAASPYFDGPLLQDSSIYESKTSSCGVTGLPLVTTTQNVFTPTTPSSATATPTCSGNSYTIQPGDSCNSVAQSQGISTGWLLIDNNLPAYCSQFPTNGTLCLVNSCSVYTARTNDTCDSIASAGNITVAQFKAWNPVINAGCYNLNTMTGMEFCIKAPGTPYVAASVTFLAPSTASTAVPVPTNIAANTNTDCGEYYEALLGNNCNMIVIKFGLSLNDFVFLNPAINANCTNLYADTSYCVEAVGDINTYPGRPGYHTAGSTSVATIPSIPYSALANATYTTRSATSTPSPLANDTRTDCNAYFQGDVFTSQDISGTNWNSFCELAVAVYNVDLADFLTWNPSLGDMTQCTFSNGVRYCGKLYFGDAAVPAMATSSLPIRNGTTSDCTQYADVTSGWTCQDILDEYSLTIAQFYAYNNEVNSDCTGLWPDYQYCIRTPDYVDETQLSPSTTGASPTTTSRLGNSANKPASPIQSDQQPTNCNRWYTAESGDSCGSIELTYFITHAQFLSWNSAVSSDCSIWAGYAYCVGTTDTVSFTRISTTALSTTTTIVPQPCLIQSNNVISNCNKYAQALSGDVCPVFASNNKITAAQLYSWNSVLGSDESGCSKKLWAGYYYCVGVS